jgi:choline dehydrogenase-like flavoprotein
MSDPNFDAVIVGAGFSGAMIAKQLALAGKRVLVLEAGDESPVNVNDYMERFYTASAKVPESPYTPSLFAPSGGLTDPTTLNAGRPTVLTLDAASWKDPKQAYLIQNGPLAFGSTYERIGGGTGRHWLGSSFRFVPNDFKMQTAYGQMVDWPIGYDDLSPWYGEAETEIGVSADVGDQGYLGINFPTGYAYPMAAIPPSLVDQAVAASVDGTVIDNVAIKVRSTPAGRNSTGYRNRRQCAGNTNCIPICPIQAKYDPSVSLNDALATGNVTVKFNTVASEVVVDANGRVTGISYIEYKTPSGPRTGGGSAQAKVFILAAHAIETPKLLLMSKNDGRTPTGVANSSGQVGKNLMDHPLYLAWALAANPIFPYRGPLSTSGIEDLRDGAFRHQRAAFRVEIGNEGWNFPIGDPNTTTLDFINGMNKSGLNTGNAALFGSDLVNTFNDRFSRQFRFGFLVEQTPEERNCVTLAAQTDNLGLPRPAIQYDLSQYTKDGLIAAKKTAELLFAKMNAKPATTAPSPNDPSSFAAIVDGKETRINYFGSGHIVGTHRMGSDKTKSVVDANLRSWDHPNLFITGSGAFPTVATGNPTLTLCALALRAANAILKSDLHP